MKKIVLISIVALLVNFAKAQNSVGIGTNTPNPNAVLDIVSTDQGLLIPRLDTATILAMPLGAADDGMLVYADEINAFAYWDGDSLDWYFLNENVMNNNGNDDDWYFGGDTLFNNSTYVVVGNTSPILDAVFTARDNYVGASNIGVFGEAENGTDMNVGVVGRGSGNGTDTTAGVIGVADNINTLGVGVRGEANITSSGSQAFGGSFEANDQAGNSDIRGVEARAIGVASTIQAIGIHASANGALTNWAGYFQDGNVYIQNRLGINESNPNAGAHINMGATNNIALQLTSSGAGFGSGIWFENLRSYSVYTNNGGDFVIADETAGAGRIQINPVGNVGLGTTNPQQLLTLSTPGSTTLRLERNSGAQFDWEMNVDNLGFHLKGGANGTGAALTDFVNVDGFGKVGIGTTTPTEKLEIFQGTLRIDDGVNPYTLPISDGGAGDVLTTDGSGNVGWQSVGGGDNEDADGDTKMQVEESADEDKIRFDLAGTEHFVMEQNANGAARLEFHNPIAAGYQSVFIGDDAGLSASGANRSVGVGVQSLQNLTTGSYNIGIGWLSGRAVTTGRDNIGIGVQSVFNNQTGNYNIGIGEVTLASAGTNINRNVAIGHQAGRNVNSNDNTFVGYFAGTATTTGGNNVALGNNAGDLNTIGSSNTFIGSSADPIANNLTNATAIGANSIVQASNTVQLGNNANVDFDLALMPNGDAGAAGEVLTSSGPGVAPTWQAASGADTDWTENASYVYNNTKQVVVGNTSTGAGTQMEIETPATRQMGLMVDNNYTGAAQTWGYVADISPLGTGPKYGIQNLVRGNASQTNDIMGAFNQISAGNTENAYGTWNNFDLSNGHSGAQYGTFNDLVNNGTGNKYGSYSDLVQAAGANELAGTYNNISHNGTGHSIPTYNNILGVGSGNQWGTYNQLHNSGTGIKIGTNNSIQQGAVANSSIIRGTYNWIISNSTSNQNVYGDDNLITNNTVGGNSYGVFNTFNGSTSGNEYGIYSQGEDYNYFSGNVGIGVNSPGNSLHIIDANSYQINLQSSGSTSGIIMSNTSATAWQMLNFAGEFRLFDGTADRITVEPNGNVGIGIVNPASLLHVHDGSGTQSTIRLTHTGNGSLGAWLSSDNNQTYLINYEATPIKFATSGADRMTISATGDVGIGTTSPAAKLDVRGSLYFPNAGTPGVGKVLTSDGAGNATWQTISGGSDGDGIYDGSGSLSGTTSVTYGSNNLIFSQGSGTTYVNLTNGGGNWNFQVGGATRSRFSNNGDVMLSATLYTNNATSRVGIGTSSPSAKLDVVGNVQIQDGTEIDGGVLTSDATGTASWKPKRWAFNMFSNVNNGFGATEPIPFTGDYFNHNVSTDGVFFEIEHAGVYQFNYSIFTTAVGGSTGIEIFSDNIGPFHGAVIDGQQDESIVSSTTIYLEAGDVIHLRCMGDINLIGSMIGFSGHLVYAD